MSISKKVSAAFANLIAGDPEESLYQICSAVDATAKREGRSGGKSRYKGFLRANHEIIYGFGLGVMIDGVRLNYAIPGVNPAPGGSYDFEDILYHIVRCGLYHESKLPDDIIFTKNRIGNDSKGNLLFPETLITGIIMSVVASPANAGETACKQNYSVPLHNEKFNVNQFWGKASFLRGLMRRAIAKRSALGECDP